MCEFCEARETCDARDFKSKLEALEVRPWLIASDYLIFAKELKTLEKALPIPDLLSLSSSLTEYTLKSALSISLFYIVR